MFLTFAFSLCKNSRYTKKLSVAYWLAGVKAFVKFIDEIEVFHEFHRYDILYVMVSFSPGSEVEVQLVGQLVMTATDANASIAVVDNVGHSISSVTRVLVCV